MIKITSALDKGKWEAFVLNHPNGNIFHTPLMHEIFKHTKNYDPIIFAAQDDSDNIIGLLHAVIIKETDSILGGLTARSIVQGGMLYTSVNALRLMMEKYDEIVQKKAIYTQIRNLWNTDEIKNILVSEGYTYDEHLNYLINLDRESEEIWGDIHKSRRKGLNRAEKDGITIKKIENIEGVDDCYYLIKKTYNNVKVPLVDITLLKTAYKLLSPVDAADFYIATKNNEPVGTRIVLKYKGFVHDWYAGSDKGIPYVDEALVWRILRDNAGKQKIFDFGGAGHPQKPYGVREFKKRFGGNEVNFGRYEKIHSLLKKKSLEVAFNIYRKLR